MKVAFIHGARADTLHLIPQDLPHVLIECPRSRLYTDEQMQQLADCDAIYVTGAYITEQVFEAAKKLKIVQTAGTGYEKLDLAAANRRGIFCCNNADMNSSRVADLAMMLTVSLLRNYVPTVVNMDVGRNWEAGRREGVKALETQDKTLGIIGFGNIGHKLGRRAYGFDMNVIYYDIDKNAHKDMAKQIGAKLVSKDELCRRADVISVHTPLNEQSKNMLSAREFAMMKDGVFVVCTARGGIIDERALREGLESGKVAGAAIDVFPVEPILPDNPMIGAPRAYLTPHVAGRGKEGVVRSFNAALANIRKAVAGKRPINILNPEARPEPKKASAVARKSNGQKAVRKAPSGKKAMARKALLAKKTSNRKAGAHGR